jgi:hypothetical protein
VVPRRITTRQQLRGTAQALPAGPLARLAATTEPVGEGGGVARVVVQGNQENSGVRGD